jgi:hypothetical protein
MRLLPFAAAGEQAFTVLAVPMVIVTLVLISALIICPFLSVGHRHLVTGLLADL